LEIAIGIGIVVLVAAIYIITYILNEKTKVPEGCEDLTDFSGCQSCTNGACSIKKKIDKEAK